jgi:hypothetical protein
VHTGRWNGRRISPWGIPLLCTLLVGCTTAPPSREQRAARQSLAADQARGRAMVYFLGDSYQGHGVSFYYTEGGITYVGYGTCATGGDGGCAVPMQVQTQVFPPALSGAVFNCSRDVDLRGVPVITFGDAPLLITGTVGVSVFPASRGAIARLRSLDGSVKAEAPLPPPTQANMEWVKAECH